MSAHVFLWGRNAAFKKYFSSFYSQHVGGESLPFLCEVK